MARGDEEAFRQLYRRHAPALFAFARRLVGGDHQAAEDVLQEAWIRAVERLNRFAWRSELRTWLSGILINCARESLRRLGRLPPLDAADIAEPSPGPPVERLDLEQAIAALPAGYRIVLVLHDIEGYSHDDIAQILGVEPGTSKSQLARARRALRRSLEPSGNPALPE
ncbi:MAG TPA: RNA polymerase sigma factor [Gemmatimonadales bacterium]